MKGLLDPRVDASQYLRMRRTVIVRVNETHANA